jgi:hypothetical protein
MGAAVKEKKRCEFAAAALVSKSATKGQAILGDLRIRYAHAQASGTKVNSTSWGLSAGTTNIAAATLPAAMQRATHGFQRAARARASMAPAAERSIRASSKWRATGPPQRIIE